MINNLVLKNSKIKAKTSRKKSNKPSKKPSKKSSIKRMFSGMMEKIKSVYKTDKSKKPSKKSRKCRDRLSDKIAINMREYKNGRYKSPKQAIAVSYSQINKMYPNCRRHLKKMSK